MPESLYRSSNCNISDSLLRFEHLVTKLVTFYIINITLMLHFTNV